MTGTVFILQTHFLLRVQSLSGLPHTGWVSEKLQCSALCTGSAVSCLSMRSYISDQILDFNIWNYHCCIWYQIKARPVRHRAVSLMYQVVLVMWCLLMFWTVLLPYATSLVLMETTFSVDGIQSNWVLARIWGPGGWSTAVMWLRMITRDRVLAQLTTTMIGDEDKNGIEGEREREKGEKYTRKENEWERR